MMITNDKIKVLVMGQQRMLDSITRIDQSMQVTPGWWVGELVAHLIGWDELLVRLIEEVVEHGQNEQVRIDTIDSYNLASVAKRQNLTLGEITNQYVAVRKDLLGLLAKIPKEVLELEILLPWGDMGTIDQVVEIWIDHENEHLNEINTIIEQGKTQ